MYESRKKNCMKQSKNPTKNDNFKCCSKVMIIPHAACIYAAGAFTVLFRKICADDDNEGKNYYSLSGKKVMLSFELLIDEWHATEERGSACHSQVMF